MHYRARAYSPRQMRFLQNDPPVGNRAEQHYAYVANNPVSRTDPSGNYWIIPEGTDPALRNAVLDFVSARFGTRHRGPAGPGSGDGWSSGFRFLLGGLATASKGDRDQFSAWNSDESPHDLVEFVLTHMKDRGLKFRAELNSIFDAQIEGFSGATDVTKAAIRQAWSGKEESAEFQSQGGFQGALWSFRVAKGGASAITFCLIAGYDPELWADPPPNRFYDRKRSQRGTFVYPGWDSSPEDRAMHEEPRDRQGRDWRLERMLELELDPKTPSHIRGWLQNERRMIQQGKRKTPRMPPGWVLGHPPGKRAEDGFDYSNAELQTWELNMLEEMIRRLLKK